VPRHPRPCSPRCGPRQVNLARCSPTRSVPSSRRAVPGRSSRWDVLAYNAKTVEYFPWMRYSFNVMERALTWFEACTQLVDWEEEWAMPMPAQLRAHAVRWRTDERLRAVIETVRADPAARKLWDAPDLPAITHPVSDQPRRLYLTSRGARNSPSGSSRERLTNFPCATSWVSHPPRLYRVTGDLQGLRLRRLEAELGLGHEALDETGSILELVETVLVWLASEFFRCEHAPSTGLSSGAYGGSW